MINLILIACIAVFCCVYFYFLKKLDDMRNRIRLIDVFYDAADKFLENKEAPRITRKFVYGLTQKSPDPWVLIKKDWIMDMPDKESMAFHEARQQMTPELQDQLTTILSLYTSMISYESVFLGRYYRRFVKT